MAFDLYIIRSWNGNISDALLSTENPFDTPEAVGPDRWQFSLDGKLLLDTTFSNMPAEHQAYPGWYLQDSYVRWSGAQAVNTLGYLFEGQPMDSVYHLVYYLPHTAPDLTLFFEALGLQDLPNESWGLDNVQVSLSDDALLEVFLPLLVK